MGKRFWKFRPLVELCEDRAVPAAFGPVGDDSISVSPDDGGIPRVKIIDPATGEDVGEIQAFEDAFRGGVRSALGDVTGDGVRDVAIVPGTGGAPRLRLLDGASGAVLADFNVYEDSFRGGLYVALGDVTGDGKADIITGTGDGGSPRVRVLDGATLGQTVIRDYFAYEPTFRGGVIVAAGDVNGDGRDDVITGTGVGGGPRVITFSGIDNAVLQNFFAYEDRFRGGVLVAAGDTDGDGRDDVITGTGPGGGPVVRVVSGSGAELMRFLADDSAFRGGVGVDSSDIDGDGRDDVVTHTRHGNAVSVGVFDDHGGLRLRTFSRTVDDNPSANDLIEGGSGGTAGGGIDNSLVSSKVEGTVTAVDAAGRTVTIRTRAGSSVVVRAGAGTKIERNDAHTTLAAFKVGDLGEAKIGADGIALQIEAAGA